MQKIERAANDDGQNGVHHQDSGGSGQEGESVHFSHAGEAAPGTPFEQADTYVGGYSGEGIRRALNEITELDGGQGKLVNNGQREWKPSPVVKMVKDGKFVLYQP